MAESCRRKDLAGEREPSLVLIVDYSDDLGELYASYFEHLGHPVLRADGAAEDLFDLLAAEPAAVVIDLGGSSLHECNIAQQIRELVGDAVIVVLSSHPNDADWVEGDSGPDIVLPKPCVPSTVAQHVRSRLAVISAGASGPPPVPSSRRSSHPPPPRSKRRGEEPRARDTTAPPPPSVTPAYSRGGPLVRGGAARRRSRV